METKTCESCGKSLLGMKDCSRRRFCSMNCYGLSVRGTPNTAADGRYQAQAIYKATECEKCGAVSGRLHRHHVNHDATDNSPQNIQILCAKCHTEEHRKPPKMSKCAVCGEMFVAKSHRSRAKICSAPCASEWGRINARKRWGAG